jgi:septal ring factor EnvC (AmiA/AmiB activator)
MKFCTKKGIYKMTYHKYYIETLNDNMLNFKHNEETEHLKNMQDDLDWMQSYTPNKKVYINELQTMIKAQEELISKIEKELNNRKVA